MLWTELYHKIQVIGQVTGIIILLLILVWIGLLMFGSMLADWYDKRNKRRNKK